MGAEMRRVESVMRRRDTPGDDLTADMIDLLLTTDAAGRTVPVFGGGTFFNALQTGTRAEQRRGFAGDIKEADPEDRIRMMLEAIQPKLTAREASLLTTEEFLSRMDRLGAEGMGARGFEQRTQQNADLVMALEDNTRATMDLTDSQNTPQLVGVGLRTDIPLDGGNEAIE